MTSQVLRAKEQGMRHVSVRASRSGKLRADTEAAGIDLLQFNFEKLR